MTVLVHAEPFYLFMYDHKVAAAAAIGEPGWAGLGAILQLAPTGWASANWLPPTYRRTCP